MSQPPADQIRADSVRVATALGANAWPLRTVAEHCGLSPARAEAALSFLVDEGRAVLDGTGAWRLT